MKPFAALLFVIFAVILSNFGFRGGSVSASNENTFQFTFDADAEGWVTSYADYPVGDDEFYELTWRWDSLPDSLAGNGLFVSGSNHSDDLFMFVKKPITGLLPSTAYTVTIDIELATDVPSDCAGIGGAPGESVFVKVGATTVEPDRIIVEDDYRMNIDKGNQSMDGRDARVVGNIANSRRNCESGPYEIKALSNTDQPIVLSTDSAGSLWVFAGTDSGFEGTTSIYYAAITVVAIQVADTPTATPTDTATATPTDTPTDTPNTPLPTSTPTAISTSTPEPTPLPLRRIYLPVMSLALPF